MLGIVRDKKKIVISLWTANTFWTLSEIICNDVSLMGFEIEQNTSGVNAGLIIFQQVIKIVSERVKILYADKNSTEYKFDKEMQYVGI